MFWKKMLDFWLDKAINFYFEIEYLHQILNCQSKNISFIRNIVPFTVLLLEPNCQPTSSIPYLISK